MQYQKITEFCSAERIQRYRKLCKSDEETIKLYEANLEVSRAFYPLLSSFETFLRNNIDNAFTTRFGDDWLYTERKGAGFLKKVADANEQAARRRAKKQGKRVVYPPTQAKKIEEAISKLKKRNEVLAKSRQPRFKITRGKVIAELSFGFWTMFYRKDYHAAAGGLAVNKCFRFRPKGLNYSQINGHLFNIRDLRNRIYHNEPICFGRGCIDFSKALQTRREIYELLTWMDRDLPVYVQQFDAVEVAVKQWEQRK